MIHAEERGTPAGREKITLKLITDLPVRSRRDAVEKIRWYASPRWKIEVFHKVLKSGCNAEEAKLRTAQRLTNLIALLCIIAWRVFWMTMLNRCNPNAPPTLALTRIELALLDHAVPDKAPPTQNTLAYYLHEIREFSAGLGPLTENMRFPSSRDSGLKTALSVQASRKP